MTMITQSLILTRKKLANNEEEIKMENNIAEALRYAVELAQKEEPIVKDADGKEFYDSNSFRLVELDTQKYANRLTLTSLSSVITYVLENVDKTADKKIIIHVESPTKVSLFTELDKNRKRELLLVSEPLLPQFMYGRFYAPEEFNISLQSSFINENDRDLLLEFSSAIRIENNTDLEDNGVSQTTRIQNGVASIGTAKAPNPVTLKPYRTFLEVDQPESQFIYRLNNKGESALFESDGGNWRNEAITNVKLYILEALSEAVKDVNVVVLG